MPRSYKKGKGGFGEGNQVSPKETAVGYKGTAEKKREVADNKAGSWA